MTTFKGYFYFLFCLPVVFLVGCSKDDKEPEDLCVYVESAGQEAEVFNTSTINFQKSDTLVVIVEGGVVDEGSASGDYVVQTDGDLEVSLSDTANNVYYVTATENGTGGLFVSDNTLATSGVSGSSTLVYIYANVVIHDREVNWSVYDDQNAIITVDDDDLEDEISTDLIFRKIYSPRTYLLDYTTTGFPNYGSLKLIFRDLDGQRDTVAGTFVEQIVSGDTIVDVRYSDESRRYQFNRTRSDRNLAILWEDLTEEYKEEYPDQSITRVIEGTTIIYSDVSYSLVETDE